MKKIILTDRTENPAYYDLVARFPISEECAGFFRIGDRAAAYVQCLEWRLANPNSKLVIIDMPRAHNETLAIFVAEECPALWVFGELADEIWLIEDSEEMVPEPEGKPLYTMPIWEWWYYFNKREGFKTLRPTIRPPQKNLDTVRRLKDEWKLPERYATIQPLFDAPYATYRNQPPEFWEEIVAYLTPRMPLVILGNPANYSKMMPHPQVYSGWSRGLTVLDSIAMISQSSMHIGGETGTTIWSSLMGVNTYGIYAGVIYEGDFWFTEPMCFGGMVRINNTLDAKLTAKDIESCWENE
jgi:hypothetical protein